MARYRVDGARLSGGSECEHIILLAGVSDTDRTSWRSETHTVVSAIKRGDVFYTNDVEKATLYVNRRNGKEFVETTRDTTKKDNLLKLPRI